MYVGTILVSSLFSLIILLIIYSWIKDKHSDYFFLLLLVLAIGLFMICGIYNVENNAAKHPYTKTYTLEVYYMDGGKETIQCHCQGYIEPFLQPTRGCAYNLIVGDEVIRSVTRYKIVGVQKHMK